MPRRYMSKYLHHKQRQRRVNIPWINSSTDKWNNCRSLIDKSSWTLQFCAVLINKFIPLNEILKANTVAGSYYTFVPLSTQDGSGSGQSFDRDYLRQ